MLSDQNRLHGIGKWSKKIRSIGRYKHFVNRCTLQSPPNWAAPFTPTEFSLEAQTLCFSDLGPCTSKTHIFLQGTGFVSTPEKSKEICPVILQQGLRKIANEATSQFCTPVNVIRQSRSLSVSNRCRNLSQNEGSQEGTRPCSEFPQPIAGPRPFNRTTAHVTHSARRLRCHNGQSCSPLHETSAPPCRNTFPSDLCPSWPPSQTPILPTASSGHSTSNKYRRVSK